MPGVRHPLLTESGLIGVVQKKEATSQAFRSLPAAQQRSRVREIMELGEPPPVVGANAAGLWPARL
jgi:hypothetical protein